MCTLIVTPRRPRARIGVWSTAVPRPKLFANTTRQLNDDFADKISPQHAWLYENIGEYSCRRLYTYY